MKKVSSNIIILVLLLNSYALLAQQNLKTWPEGASPEEVGKRVTDRFLLSPHGVYTAPNTKAHIPYFEVCAWYGALTFANETSNSDLRFKLIDRFTPLFNKDSALLPVPDHVDYSVFGSIPLEIYLQTNEERYLNL